MGSLGGYVLLQDSYEWRDRCVTVFLTLGCDDFERSLRFAILKLSTSTNEHVSRLVELCLCVAGCLQE
jgi:hypothetical protein